MLCNTIFGNHAKLVIEESQRLPQIHQDLLAVLVKKVFQSAPMDAFLKRRSGTGDWSTGFSLGYEFGIVYRYVYIYIHIYIAFSEASF